MADNLSALDDVTLKIIWDRLVSVMNEAAETLYRSAFSPLVRESKDGACALLAPSGETIAIGDTALPSFATTQQLTLEAALKQFPLETWAPGDVLMTNDPWLGPAQVNDITLLKPVFYKGRLVAFTGSVAHSPDLGGVTRYNGAADVFEEGLLIPLIHLYRGGEPNETLFQLIAANSRVPQEALGDLNAQLAAQDVTERRVLAILDEYGLDDLDAVTTAILGRTEQAMRNAIAAIPDGEYRHEMDADGVPGPLERDRAREMPAMHLAIRIRVRGSEIEVDLTESSAQVEAAINSLYTFTYAYVAYTLRVMLVPNLPQNGGSTRPIQLKVEEGTVYHARRPAPTMSRAVVGHTVSDLIFGALAGPLEHRVRGNGGSTPTWVLVIVGRDYNDRPYQRVLPTNGGLGGQEGGDGLVLSFPSNTQNLGVEMLEASTPVLVDCREMIPDSGGAGRFRGGVGIRFSVRAIAKTIFSLAIGHVKHAPQGILGGAPGRAGRVDLNGRTLGPGAEGILDAGDVLTLETPGGGGFGVPGQREKERVAKDVNEGLVTETQASAAYGGFGR